MRARRSDLVRPSPGLLSRWRLGIACKSAPPEDESQLCDTGVIRVTRRFVEGLPSGRRLLGTLTTVYADRTLDTRFWFHVVAGTPDEAEGFRSAVKAVAAVRGMGGYNSPWPRTILDDIVRQFGASGPGCVEYAHALLRALADQRNPLRARLLNTCLLGNYFDCHSAGRTLPAQPARVGSPRSDIRGDGSPPARPEVGDCSGHYKSGCQSRLDRG